MMNFQTFANFRAIDPAHQRFQRITYLLSFKFKPTNSHELWEEGYDYAEYPEGSLECAENDETIIVRCVFPDGRMELHAHTCAFDPTDPEEFLSWTENYAISTEFSDEC